MYDLVDTGFYPFWFWNDDINAKEIRRQIAEMAAQGIKGFYIHSRQGLQRPYLSENFFEMIDVAIDAAEQHGLTVCFYDEYPYPSGIAGGEVVLGNPHFYATRLGHNTYLVDGGDIRLTLAAGHILSAKAYPISNGIVDFNNEMDLKKYIGMVLTEDSYAETGLTAYNRKRYFASEPRPVLEVSLPKGEYKIYVSYQAEIEKHKYWNNFVDCLNPEAMAKFIELTHERYHQRYAEKFGQSIAAIFVDEISPHWSPLVPEAFKKKYGYDICEHMTAFQDSNHPEHKKVRFEFNRLIYEMFCESFEAPVQDWCHTHGLYYCGEKPAMRFSQLNYMDIPGCDNGHKKAGAGLDILQPRLRGNARAVASAVYFYDKPIGLCECYHSLGWSGTLQDAKMIAEALLIAGIEHLVPHGFFYSTHGLKKHDAPPSFFFQMPYWPLFGYLSNRVAKLGDLFKDSYIDAKVLVVDVNSGLPTREQLKTYENLLETLSQAHIDFHVCDTDVLEQGKMEDGQLKVKDLTIDLIILPPMTVIEPELQQWIEQYENKGGRVLHYNDQEEQDFLTKLSEVVKPSLSITSAGKEIKGIYAVKRVRQGQTFWFVLNANDQEIVANLAADGPLSEINLSATESPKLQKQANNQYQRVIKPFESFVISQEINDTLTNEEIPLLPVRVKNQVSFSLHNENLLRIYEWDMSLLDEKLEPVQSARVPAVPISDQLAKGQFRFSPDNKTYFGHVPELKFPTLDVSYKYYFNNNYNGKIELVMEPNSIEGEWTILINDNQYTKSDFYETDAHVHGSLAIDITADLVEENNCIQIMVKASKPNHGLVNCLYLAGNFGLELEPDTLVEPITEGLFEDYVNNKIPFYTGVIEYSSSFISEELPDSKEVLLEMDYGCKFNEATEVSINGGEYQPVLWYPRVAKVAVSDLKVGVNEIKTKVYTTLIRSFEGSYFDDYDHVYRSIRNE